MDTIDREMTKLMRFCFALMPVGVALGLIAEAMR